MNLEFDSETKATCSTCAQVKLNINPATPCLSVFVTSRDLHMYMLEMHSAFIWNYWESFSNATLENLNNWCNISYEQVKQ